LFFFCSFAGHRKSAAFLDVPTINLNYLQVSDGDDDDNYRLRTFSASKQGEWKLLKYGQILIWSDKKNFVNYTGTTVHQNPSSNIRLNTAMFAKNNKHILLVCLESFSSSSTKHLFRKIKFFHIKHHNVYYDDVQ
jgi:hypothetical protein